MKRMPLRWVIGIGCAGVALGLLLLGQHRDSATAIAEEVSQSPASSEAAPTPPPEGEKIVHTFEDEAKMKTFANLWQQRQAILLRMTVLKTYWEQEQATLTQVNNKLAADYQVDVTKNYTMDGNRRVLIEREAPPSAATEPAPTQPPASQ